MTYELYMYEPLKYKTPKKCTARKAINISNDFLYNSLFYIVQKPLLNDVVAKYIYILSSDWDWDLGLGTWDLGTGTWDLGPGT